MSDSIKRKLRTSVATMIITWINNFDSRPGLKSIEELPNAQIFIGLIQLGKVRGMIKLKAKKQLSISFS